MITSSLHCAVLENSGRQRQTDWNAESKALTEQIESLLRERDILKSDVQRLLVRRLDPGFSTSPVSVLLLQSRLEAAVGHSASCLEPRIGTEHCTKPSRLLRISSRLRDGNMASSTAGYSVHSRFGPFGSQ